MSIVDDSCLDDYKHCRYFLNDFFPEVEPLDFYYDLFPHNECKGEMNSDYSKPNAIYFYREEGGERLKRRIMLDDTFESDYTAYVEDNSFALCSGLTYRGNANTLANAQNLNALIFDIDGVGVDELKNLFHRIEHWEKNSPRLLGVGLPRPTYLVLSGTGMHLYYVMKEPIPLFPNIKMQMKTLKYHLTSRLWDWKNTSKVKSRQYQSISQGFRMVGSKNNKYGNSVIAFKTGDRVTIEYLNQFCLKDEFKVDLTKIFRPTKTRLEDAKIKFPEWYQRVIVEKQPNHSKKWHLNKGLYNWWLNRADEIEGGHRYFFMMCLAIYAYKCDISKKQLKDDLENKVFSILASKGHSNKLTKQDMRSALESYDKALQCFTIDDVEHVSGLRITRNRRNYRSQSEHLKIARFTRDLINKNWRDGAGRPVGSGEKKELVLEWRRNNPTGKKIECHRETGLSRPTIDKWWTS